MTPKAKDSIEKAAYTAVGAPIAAVKAVGARISDMRRALRDSGDDLTDDLAREFETWVAEGERVVSAALRRLRTTGATDHVRATGRAIVARAGQIQESMDETLDIIEPDGSLKQIRGIGPSTAERLRGVGVGGVASLLESTATSGDIEELAGRSGHSAETISGWRRQADLGRVDGIGESYQRLLHRLGIWTLDQLSKANPGILAAEMERIEWPGLPDRFPGEDQVGVWVEQAAGLAR